MTAFTVSVKIGTLVGVHAGIRTCGMIAFDGNKFIRNIEQCGSVRAKPHTATRTGVSVCREVTIVVSVVLSRSGEHVAHGLITSACWRLKHCLHLVILLFVNAVVCVGHRIVVCNLSVIDMNRVREVGVITHNIHSTTKHVGTVLVHRTP